MSAGGHEFGDLLDLSREDRVRNEHMLRVLDTRGGGVEGVASLGRVVVQELFDFFLELLFEGLMFTGSLRGPFWFQAV